MATPYEFVANQLHLHLPGATAEPLIDTNGAERRTREMERIYHSEEKDGSGIDYSRYSLSFPGGYPFYYPLRLTQPSRQPLKISIAHGQDFMERFTRPDGEIRDFLAHYGYWRIEISVNPATTDFWILMLGLKDDASQYLVLPTGRLKLLLSQAHNPEKFSLLLAKSGVSFAAQPLSAANRLAVLKNPSLLDGPEYHDLDMRRYLNNWQQLGAHNRTG